MSDVIRELLALLDLEQFEADLFRGQSCNIVGKNVFGGQVLSQALMAAGRTVEGQLAHSLHAYFLRAGDINSPIVYQVERVRDGKSFSTRTVKAIQHGRPIFTMTASFQVAEEGLEHQRPMPEVPGPDGIPSETELRRMTADLLPEKLRPAWVKERPIELRLIDPINPFAPQRRDAWRCHWMRAQMQLPDDPFLHQCILAFASDFVFMGTAMMPHGVTFLQPNMQAASLDHAMWFHRDFRADEWLLYEMDGPSASGGRGMNRGFIYTQSGKLVATVAQEGLMRLREVAEKY